MYRLIRSIIPEAQPAGATARVGVVGEGRVRREDARARHAAAGLTEGGASGEGVGAVAFPAVFGPEEAEVVGCAVGGADGVGHVVVGEGGSVEGATGCAFGGAAEVGGGADEGVGGEWAGGWRADGGVVEEGEALGSAAGLGGVACAGHGAGGGVCESGNGGGGDGCRAVASGVG